jgi:hypothetical protein
MLSINGIICEFPFYCECIIIVVHLRGEVRTGKAAQGTPLEPNFAFLRPYFNGTADTAECTNVFCFLMHAWIPISSALLYSLQLPLLFS